MKDFLGKDIIFVNSEGTYYDQDPAQATSSSGSGGEQTFIGSQIGVLGRCTLKFKF